jgi:hypothetical protein
MKIPGLLHSIVMAFCSVNISSLIMQLVIALSLRAILSLHLALVLGMRRVHGTILDRPGSDPRLSERRTLRLKLLAAGQWADSLGCDVASDPYPSFPQSYPSIHLLLTSAQVTSADTQKLGNLLLYVPSSSLHPSTTSCLTCTSNLLLI